MNSAGISSASISDALVAWFARRLGRLSRPALLRRGTALGWFYGHVIRQRRAEAFAALRRSIPELSAAAATAELNGMYRNLALNLLEILRMYGGATEELDQILTIEGEDIIRAALAHGRGAMILTAHLGNFDLLGMFASHRGYPLTIVSKKIKQATVNRVWYALRERFGIQLLFAHNAARGCLKALRANQLVGFMLDQNRPRGQGVFVQFFGRPASTSPGLAVLASQAEAPVIPVFLTRRADGTHHLRVWPAIEPPPDRTPASILLYTQRYTAIIEAEIRAHPSQWIWIHRRWKVQPLPGDAVATPTGPLQPGA